MRSLRIPHNCTILLITNSVMYLILCLSTVFLPTFVFWLNVASRGATRSFAGIRGFSTQRQQLCFALCNCGRARLSRDGTVSNIDMTSC